MKSAGLGLMAVMAAAMLAACGTSEQPASSRPAGPAASRAATAAAKVHCVICGPGHQFEIDATTLTAEHDGKRFYLCSEHCRDMFAKDPVKWATRDAKR